MKVLKTLVAIALSATGLGSAVTLGVVANNDTNKVQQAEAASTFTVGQTLFLNPSSNWKQNNARFAAYFFGSNGDTWESMSTNDFSPLYQCNVPSGSWTNVIFCRMNGSATANNWNNKWNQTGNLNPGNGDVFKIPASGWDSFSDSGNWSNLNTTYSWDIKSSVETDGTWTNTNSLTLSYKNDGDGAQFYSTAVDLKAGQQFKICRTTDNKWFGSNKFENGTNSAVQRGYISLGNNDANVSVLKDISMELYVKVHAGTVWTQVSSEAEATAWAQTFLNDTNSICSNGGTSANHLSALQAIWADLKSSFEGMTLGAKHIIDAGTANATVTDAHDRYVHIMSRYGGESGLEAFEDGPALATRTMLQVINKNTTRSIIILVASIIALSSVGTFFLLRRKRKEQ